MLVRWRVLLVATLSLPALHAVAHVAARLLGVPCP